MPVGVDPIGRIIGNLFAVQRIGNSIEASGRTILSSLFDQIEADVVRINPVGPSLQKWRTYRLDQLIDKIDERVATAFPAWQKQIRSELAVAARAQGQWASATLINSLGLPAASGVIRPTPITQALAKTILDTQPFGAPGSQHVLADWAAGLSTSTRNRIVGQIRTGMTFEESIPQMVRRVRGTSVGYKEVAGKLVHDFRGGVWTATTRDAESIVRTGVTSISSHAHLETYRANAHALLGVQYSATLDDRTTLLCFSLDGTIWAVDDPQIVVPGDATHVRCRSTLVPVPDYEKFGLEPPPDGYRKARDLSGITDKELKNKITTRRGKGAKGLGKQVDVPSKTIGEEWLREQPRRIQDKVLGKERAELFRTGKISLKDMVRSDRTVIPVRDLRAAAGPRPTIVKSLSAELRAVEKEIAEAKKFKFTPETRAAFDAEKALIDAEYNSGAITREEWLARHEQLPGPGRLMGLERRQRELQSEIFVRTLPETLQFAGAEARTVNVALGAEVDATFPMAERQAAKRLIAERIGKKIPGDHPGWVDLESKIGDHIGGYLDPEEGVSNLIRNWAKTSADSDVLAAAMQQLAAGEFELEISAAHWERWAAQYADRNLGKYVGKQNPATGRNWTTKEAKTELKWKFKNKVNAVMDGDSGDLLRSFLRAQYDETQAWFAEKGITHVPLSRGITGADAAQVLGVDPINLANRTGGWQVGLADVDLQALSSFATQVDTAEAFGSTLTFIRVPVKNILSTCRTGFGCLSEFEMIAMGRSYRALVMDLDAYKKILRTFLVPKYQTAAWHALGNADKEQAIIAALERFLANRMKMD